MRRTLLSLALVLWLGASALPATAQDVTMTSDELLPRVSLTVEEVEPGVYRVVNDGVRDLTYHPEQSDLGWRSPLIIAGDDGGIWVIHGDVYYRLGRDHTRAEDPPEWKSPNLSLPDGVDRVTDFEVTPDGTVWTAIGTTVAPPNTPEDALYIWSSHGEDGVLHMPTPRLPFGSPVEVTPDGTVWAVWLDDPLDDHSAVFGYLGDDGWMVVGDWPDRYGGLSVSDTGEVWAPGRMGWFHSQPRRFVDGAWQEIGGYPVFVDDARVGPEGTLWGIGFEGSVRFDGAEWMVFESPDWLPTDHGGWMLVEDEWVSVPGSEFDAIHEAVIPGETAFRASFWGMPWGEPHVAPDGSLWVPARLGVWWDNAGQPVCAHGIDGVARFDGETWSRYLRGHCVEAMDIAADGSVWLAATESDARFPIIRLYVITPEAVAASG